MTDTQDDSRYPRAYNQWAGNPQGTRPDYTRCCMAVTGRLGWRSIQCSRPRGHGPGLAYCKQHDPVAAKAKRDAKYAKWKAEIDAKHDAGKRAEDRREAFLAALEAIAAGHNDPRSLALKTLEDWK